MPYQKIKTSLSDTAIGLWNISEDESFFLERLTLYENELLRLENISHPKKRLEWLSSRLCLKELLKLNHKVESLNQTSGKPYLTDNSHKISYTHSSSYAAAIASSASDVAIDIESRDRVRNPETRRLFMNPEENAYYEETQDMLFFLLLWSAKESLFKIVGQKGISLRQHISIDLKSFPQKPNGKLSGIVKKDDLEKSYDVYYAIRPEFVLTYIVDSLPEVQIFSEELFGCA